MLIVSTKPNGGYSGQFKQLAADLVRQGKRVGMMHVSGERQVHCHVCNKDFEPPVTYDQIHKDAFGECSHCKTAFIFAKI